MQLTVLFTKGAATTFKTLMILSIHVPPFSLFSIAPTVLSDPFNQQ